jgi:hypothetical protein
MVPTMSGRSKQGELFEAPPGRPGSATVAINARCALRTAGGHRVVLGGGVPLAHFAIGDRMAEAYAIVTLVEQGWAEQVEVALAFGCTTRTVRRMQRRFELGGLSALGRGPGYPKGRARQRPGRARELWERASRGLSNRAIGARLGVTERAVRKALARAGWRAPAAATQLQLQLPVVAAPADPNLSAVASAPEPTVAESPAEAAQPEPCAITTTGATALGGADPNLSGPATAGSDEPLPVSFDTDPADRRVDRAFARMGLLCDALPIFRAGPRIARAGVLLAVPALVHTGALDCAREVYGSVGPAFYGLRTCLLAMLLMALLRIQRPEQLKQHAPDELGRLLGLDRAPEVKTLRRRLAQLAATRRATDFGRALAARRVATHGATLGFLYVDGHVRVYHGKHKLPKTHVTQRRIALPATTDYWVNDAAGEPLLVVTAEANAGLVAMLPPLLNEVRKLIGQRRVTVVFDRGGWSPRLFQALIEAGFDLLTYRKGRCPRLAPGRFRVCEATLDGRPVRYRLADEQVQLLDGKLTLRQVTRLSDNGQHQTMILTSRTDLPAVTIALRMFERWRQENFFKYLGEQYALDALIEHRTEPADPLREVPNPRRKALDAELRLVQAAILRLAALYGMDAIGPDARAHKTMRAFCLAHADRHRDLTAALKRYADVEKKRASTPRRVPVQQTIHGPVVKLATERKHLSNLIKMVAYQAESELVRAVSPHYARADDEGRSLIQAALASAADLELRDAELLVTLAPQSSPHRTRALAALCDELNRRPTRFPGTRLTLRFATHDPHPAPQP